MARRKWEHKPQLRDENRKTTALFLGQLLSCGIEKREAALLLGILPSQVTDLMEDVREVRKEELNMLKTEVEGYLDSLGVISIKTS